MTVASFGQMHDLTKEYRYTGAHLSVNLGAVLLEHLLILESIGDGEGVANLTADPRRPAVLLGPNVEYDGHPPLEEGVAAEAAGHGLIGAVDLHLVLLDEAKIGERARTRRALDFALLRQRVHGPVVQLHDGDDEPVQPTET